MLRLKTWIADAKRIFKNYTIGEDGTLTSPANLNKIEIIRFFMNKAVLTIGAGAIGGAIAKFAKQGMTVCVRRTESKIIELAKEINQSGGKAFGFA